MVSKSHLIGISILALGFNSLFADEVATSEAILPAYAYCDDGSQELQRRRPGFAVDQYKLPLCDEETNKEGIRPWVDPVDFGPAVPDRWRIVETIGITTNLWDPYNAHNPLKGDMPVWGKDWFYSIIGISDTIVEPRRFPIPVGNATTSRSGSLDTIGAGETLIMAQSPQLAPWLGG
jgi:hypothetical protein